MDLGSLGFGKMMMRCSPIFQSFWYDKKCIFSILIITSVEKCLFHIFIMVIEYQIVTHIDHENGNTCDA